MRVATARLLERLEGVREVGEDRWVARCPAHDDRCASLSVRELDDGRVLIHDFAACGTSDILAALGLSMSDLFAPRREHHVRPTRARMPAADALKALLLEATVAHVAAEDVAAGRSLTAADRARLALAVDRLADAVRVCHVR